MELSAYHPFRSAKAKEQYLALYDLRAKRWPVASETRMVETACGQTFVRSSGPMDGQPLVLLPGGGTSSLIWELNIAALSACYRTYAVDNIYDVGRSIYTCPIRSPDDFANWLDELFTALALGNQIYLMGLSYGGCLASQYALRFPNRLSKTVLLAPVATVLPLPLEFTIRLLLCLVLPQRYYLRRFVSWWMPDMHHKARQDESFRMWVEEFMDEVRMGIRCFKPKPMVGIAVLTDKELRSLQVPTLYLVGEHEKIYSAQKAVQRLKMVAPQIKAEVIPQAGHDLAGVQAEMVNRKVLEFLKQP
jgi:pimeloyl-ACP methyl ester carboxylesterase